MTRAAPTTPPTPRARVATGLPASRLFFAVVASGIAFGAAACASSSDGEATPAAQPAPASRVPARPSVQVVDASVDAPAATEETHGGGCDAGPDAQDSGWCPTK